MFTGVGVAFVASVHLGPAADDTVAMVRNGYAGEVPGVIAVALLGVQVLVLATTCVYATGRWRASRTLQRR